MYRTSGDIYPRWRTLAIHKAKVGQGTKLPHSLSKTSELALRLFMPFYGVPFPVYLDKKGVNQPDGPPGAAEGGKKVRYLESNNSN